MVTDVKWCGFDFGQCLMDPSGLRNYLVIGDVCKELCEPELINERIHRYRVLKEKYKSYGMLKEGHKEQIIDYVFDGIEEAREIFAVKEQEHLQLGKGAEEALQYLKEMGIHLAVVAELKTTLGRMGTDIVSRFLINKGLTQYFEEVVTPQGRIDLSDSSIDLKYKGKSKEDGTLYDELVEDLRAQGIKTSEAVMIGDKPGTDINPAKHRGFKTIQYIAYMDMGTSESDYRISDFRELKEIIKRKV